MLIGDAARLMLPVRGQGTGFAIEDATVLAPMLLKSAGMGSEELRRAASEYAGERQKRSKRMAMVAEATGRTSLGATWTSRVVRSLGFKWLPKLSSVE